MVHTKADVSVHLALMLLLSQISQADCSWERSPVVLEGACKNAINLRSVTSPYSGRTFSDGNQYCASGSPAQYFYVDIVSGQSISIRQTTNNFDSVHASRRGPVKGPCPGTLQINSTDDPDTTEHSWRNSGFSTTRFWFIVVPHDCSYVRPPWSDNRFTIAWSLSEVSNRPVTTSVRVPTATGRILQSDGMGIGGMDSFMMFIVVSAACFCLMLPIWCWKLRAQFAAPARVAPAAAPAPAVALVEKREEEEEEVAPCTNLKVQVLDEEKLGTNPVRRESIPEYWTSNHDVATDYFDQMVYVSTEAFDCFNELLASTYRPIVTQDRPCPKKTPCERKPGGCPCVNPGGDPGLPTGFIVRRVIRVEEADMWARYVNKRDSIKGKRGDDCGRPFDPPIFTNEVVKKHDDIFSQLDDEINEVYLWHGTHVRAALHIAQNDFNIDLAGSGAGTMYGRGAYMAESCTKADEYAKDEEGGYYDSVYAIVLCRVILGKYFYTTQRDEEAQKKVTAGDFDSTCGDRARSVNTYRELVVYDKDQIYPEFVVLYNRVFQKDDEGKMYETAQNELFHMQLPVYWNNCHVDPVKTGFRVHYNVKKHTLELIQRLVKGATSDESLIVTRVRRVEDSEMWNKYVEFGGQVVARKDKTVRIEELDGDASSGHCIMEALLNDDSLEEQAISIENLDVTANELLLWHGTSKEAAEAIAEEGFQIATGRAKNGKRFGEGAYMAEDLNKSLSYAPETDGIQYVLLCRTICGDMYYTESGSETLAHLHARNNQKDSILANPFKRGPREFIVLDACQVYPEFIVEMKRDPAIIPGA